MISITASPSTMINMTIWLLLSTILDSWRQQFFSVCLVLLISTLTSHRIVYQKKGSSLPGTVISIAAVALVTPTVLISSPRCPRQQFLPLIICKMKARISYGPDSFSHPAVRFETESMSTPLFFCLTVCETYASLSYRSEYTFPHAQDRIEKLFLHDHSILLAWSF